MQWSPPQPEEESKSEDPALDGYNGRHAKFKPPSRVTVISQETMAMVKSGVLYIIAYVLSHYSASTFTIAIVAFASCAYYHFSLITFVQIIAPSLIVMIGMRFMAQMWAERKHSLIWDTIMYASVSGLGLFYLVFSNNAGIATPGYLLGMVSGIQDPLLRYIVLYVQITLSCIFILVFVEVEWGSKQTGEKHSTTFHWIIIGTFIALVAITAGVFFTTHTIQNI